MEEAEIVAEDSEPLANGTCAPKNTGEAVIEKEGNENGVKEMDDNSKEDGKVQTMKINEDHELEEEKCKKGEKKEGYEGANVEEEVQTMKINEDHELEEEACKNGEEKEGNEGVNVEEEVQTVKMNEDYELEEEHKKEEDKEGNEGVNMEEETESKESEKVEQSKDKDEKSEETEEKTSRKRGKGRSIGEAKKELNDKKAKELATPVFSVDRPVRERKSVERLVVSIEKEHMKEFLIGKGRGTALKDIPNVAYKLSRKKTDETFKMLHMILFGRRGKAFNIKYNVSQFSGFVWHENEEKQRLKIKDKFDKFVKEKLLEFCDVLDIPVSKATTKKEDIVNKLLDFLVAPHATTDVLLAEKESRNTKKRKREVKRSVTKSGGTPAKLSSRKLRKTEDTPKLKETSTSEMEDESEEGEDEDNENDAPDGSEYVIAEASESEEKEDEHKEESEEETGKQKQGLKKSLIKKESSGKTKSKKIATPMKSAPARSPKESATKSSLKDSKVDDTGDSSPEVFSRKKKNEETAKKKSSTSSKSVTKGKASKEKSGKKVLQGKDRTKKESGPTEDELRKVICEILKEVDFNTATFTDILKQLAQYFDMDLTRRKSAIKLIIQEELTKLADEDDEEGEDD